MLACLQVAITAYQPVDTVVKTVEVPVVRTIETYVPKVVIEEKVIQVPKLVPEYVEKVKPKQHINSKQICMGLSVVLGGY